MRVDSCIWHAAGLPSVRCQFEYVLLLYLRIHQYLAPELLGVAELLLRSVPVVRASS